MALHINFRRGGSDEGHVNKDNDDEGVNNPVDNFLIVQFETAT